MNYPISGGHYIKIKHKDILVEYGDDVNLEEIDNDLVPILQHKFEGKQNVTLLHQDALELKLIKTNTRIIGNLKCTTIRRYNKFH